MITKINILNMYFFISNHPLSILNGVWGEPSTECSFQDCLSDCSVNHAKKQPFRTDFIILRLKKCYYSGICINYCLAIGSPYGELPNVCEAEGWPLAVFTAIFRLQPCKYALHAVNLWLSQFVVTPLSATPTSPHKGRLCCASPLQTTI